MAIMDNNTFAIIMCDDENSKINIIDIVTKVSLRKHIGYNRIQLKNGNMAYILYNVDKDYMFEMTRNKKIKIIWKDNDFFGIIDFKENTKGNIICELTTDVTDGDHIEGDIITLNLKPLPKDVKKVILVSDKQLDEDNPYGYEHFSFYIKS